MMSFQSLYNNTFNEQADLNQVTAAHPYFTLARFFLLRQTKETGSNYNEVAAKTALHFANPYLLHHQLHADENIAGEIVVFADEKIAEESYDHRVEVMDEPLATEETLVLEETQPVQDIDNAREVVESPEKPSPQPAEKNAPLLFEPLHTTDYFASQGIKLSETVLPGDKMGKQLKSFTEWLKTMKKVHPEELKDGTRRDGFIDSSVQQLAEKSNKEEEVLTESMAEVYLQQGKTNKAKEIYEKLSLLNPSKNAYFAAKLNEIQ